VATRAKKSCFSGLLCFQKRVVVVAAARLNSWRNVAFDREAGFGTILVVVRRLTLLVGNDNRVLNRLSRNTDRDRDIRHGCEGSSAGGQVCSSL
jgi:hypothetical protein